jgi:hypothetical protein
MIGAATSVAEISYDVVMGDNMSFVEGCYRLPGGDWQVLIVSRCDVSEPELFTQRWETGVTGVLLRFPKLARLDRTVVEQVLFEALGIREWTEVRGPDSMQLR